MQEVFYEAYSQMSQMDKFWDCLPEEIATRPMPSSTPTAGPPCAVQGFLYRLFSLVLAMASLLMVIPITDWVHLAYVAAFIAEMLVTTERAALPSTAVPDVKPPPYRPQREPIGFPAALLVFSAIMWSMWTVAMHLKSTGWTWPMLFNSYFGWFPARSQKPERPPRPKGNPKQLKGYRKVTSVPKIMRLGLHSALALLADTPQLRSRAICAHSAELRAATEAGGVVNFSRLPPTTHEAVLQAIDDLPCGLSGAGPPIKRVILDTGCSRSCSGYQDDFVPGSLRALPQRISMKGVAGSLEATHVGLLHYETVNDAGNKVVLRTTGLYFPELRARLFSPQSHFSELVPDAGGEWDQGISEPVFAIKAGRVQLRFPDQAPLTVHIDESSRLPILSTFDSVDRAANSLANLGCVSAENNQNLTRSAAPSLALALSPGSSWSRPCALAGHARALRRPRQPLWQRRPPRDHVQRLSVWAPAAQPFARHYTPSHRA